MKMLNEYEKKKLFESELGSEMLKAQEKSQKVKMSKTINEIGKEVITSWNPITIKDRFPFAEIIFKEFNKMIDETIPKEAILSSRFQSWINSERNELMVDTKINRDDYFRQQVDFETGEISDNKGISLVNAKKEYLRNKIERLSKAFTTHMKKNPEIAYADKDELDLWQNYYAKQTEKVQNAFESNNFQNYDIKDKNGNIKKQGDIEDAQNHLNNLTQKLEQVAKAKEEIENLTANKQQIDNNQEEKITKDQIQILRNQQ